MNYFDILYAAKMGGGSPIPPPPPSGIEWNYDLDSFALSTCFKSIEVPEHFTKIGNGAIANNDYIEKIVFPSTIDYASEYIVNGANRLETIVFNNVFSHGDALPTIQSAPNLKRIIFDTNNYYEDIGDLAFSENHDAYPAILFVNENLVSMYKEQISAYDIYGALKAKYVLPLEYAFATKEYEWDFTGANPTKSKRDDIELIVNNVDFSSNGATFSQSNSYLCLPHNIDGVYIPAIDTEVEIYVKNVSQVATGRVITFTPNLGNSSDSASGLMWYNGNWVVWSRTGYSISNLNNFFDMSTVTLKTRKYRNNYIRSVVTYEL